MSFFTLALLGQHSFGISRALMCRVRAALAVEVDRRIPRIVGWWAVGRSILWTEALETGGGFDQRAVDREMLVAQQPQAGCLAHDFVEEPLGNLVPEQPPPVL